MTSSPSTDQSINIQNHWLLAAIGLLVLVVALWLPTGLNVSGWGDEWKQMLRMDQSGLNIPSDIRPLIAVSWWVSHFLTPDSFVGMNLLFMLALLGKGLGLYALLMSLKLDMPLVAFGAAALFVVNTNDISVFTLAVLNIHLSAAFFLLAATSLIHYWYKPRIGYAAGVLVGLFFALGIVEISVPLIAVFPVLLIILERGLSKQLVKAIALWYSIPALYVLRALILALQGNSVLGYQTGKLAADNSASTWISSFIQAYNWQLGKSWIDSVLYTEQILNNPLVLLSLVVVVVISITLYLYISRTTQPAKPMRRYVGLTIGGLAALGLGFLPFVFANFRDTNSRTTLFSSAGAAIVLVTILVIVAQFPAKVRIPAAIGFVVVFIAFYRAQPIPIRYTGILAGLFVIGVVLPRLKWRYVFMIVPIIGMGFGYSVYQHLAFQKLAQSQETVLRPLIEAAPEIRPNIPILVVVKDSPNIFTTFLNRGDVFEAALQYLYANPQQRAYLCDDRNINDPNANLATCRFEADRIHVRMESTESQIPYNKVVVFHYTEGRLELQRNLSQDTADISEISRQYAPLEQIVADAPLPKRLTTVFAH